FFFQAEDGIRDRTVTGVQTCALPISPAGIWSETSRTTGRPPRSTVKPLIANELKRPPPSPDTPASPDRRGARRRWLRRRSAFRRSEERRVGKECRSRGWLDR